MDDHPTILDARFWASPVLVMNGFVFFVIGVGIGMIVGFLATGAL